MVKGLFTLPLRCPVCGAGVFMNDRTGTRNRIDPPGLRRSYMCGVVLDTDEEDGKVVVDVIEGCRTALKALINP